MNAARAIARAGGLRGLFSIDFIAMEETCWIVDINPRPGATLDIFDTDGANLFAHHVVAMSGVLPSFAFAYEGSEASAVVYADAGAIVIPARLQFPEWVRDRPHGGTLVEAGAPVCTVHARADIAHNAKAICEERVRLVQDFLA